jgi:transposase
LIAGMSERKRYPGDLSDERWALIEPVITAWKAAHPSASGHQGGYEVREVINAILYQSRTGCQREYLPHDLPPRSAAYCYFAKWRDDGTDQAIHGLLRWHAREKKGRKADPSLVVLDTQSVHAAAPVPAGTTGKDPGKKVPGRKRCLAVDVLGLVIAVVVLAASAHENTAGTALLDKVAASTSTVSKALVDQGFKSSVVAHGATVGIDVQVVERNPADRGFVPQPERWVVEQAFGILSSAVDSSSPISSPASTGPPGERRTLPAAPQRRRASSTMSTGRGLVVPALPPALFAAAATRQPSAARAPAATETAQAAPTTSAAASNTATFNAKSDPDSPTTRSASPAPGPGGSERPG